MDEFLKENFKDSSIICDIRVEPLIIGGETEFTIYVYIKYDAVKLHNIAGAEGLRKGIRLRVKNKILDWFGINEDKLTISILYKKC